MLIIRLFSLYDAILRHAARLLRFRYAAQRRHARLMPLAMIMPPLAASSLRDLPLDLMMSCH